MQEAVVGFFYGEQEWLLFQCGASIDLDGGVVSGWV